MSTNSYESQGSRESELELYLRRYRNVVSDLEVARNKISFTPFAYFKKRHLIKSLELYKRDFAERIEQNNIRVSEQNGACDHCLDDNAAAQNAVPVVENGGLAGSDSPDLLVKLEEVLPTFGPEAAAS